MVFSLGMVPELHICRIIIAAIYMRPICLMGMAGMDHSYLP
jgi:hypothetical protein